MTKQSASHTFDKKQLVIDDLLLTYYSSLAPKARSHIVFLHGWRSNSTMWFPVVNDLQLNSTSFYFLDLPGFGGSQLPKQPFTLEDYARIVTEFITKLAIEPVTLVGHSFGGATSLLVAMNKPMLIKSLVLVDSSGIRQKTKGKMIKTLIAKILKPFFAPSFMKQAKLKVYELMGAEDYLATPELQKTYLNIISHDLTPHLSSVTQETLIVWGAKDTDTPMNFAAIMEQQIPNAHLIVLPNAGHYSFIDQKDEFVHHLSEFLT